MFEEDISLYFIQYLINTGKIVYQSNKGAAIQPRNHTLPVTSVLQIYKVVEKWGAEQNSLITIFFFPISFYVFQSLSNTFIKKTFHIFS